MSLYIYPPTPVSVSVPPINFLKDSVITTVEEDTTDHANDVPLPVKDINSAFIVDLFDTPLFPIATGIPRISTLGATARTEVVASLAAISTKITIAEDIGEFIGLYTGAANAEVLKCVLPLGGGEMSIDLPFGSRISLGHMKDVDLATATFMAITFLG